MLVPFDQQQLDAITAYAKLQRESLQLLKDKSTPPISRLLKYNTKAVNPFLKKVSNAQPGATNNTIYPTQTKAVSFDEPPQIDDLSNILLDHSITHKESAPKLSKSKLKRESQFDKARNLSIVAPTNHLSLGPTYTTNKATRTKKIKYDPDKPLPAGKFYTYKTKKPKPFIVKTINDPLVTPQTKHSVNKRPTFAPIHNRVSNLKLSNPFRALLKPMNSRQTPTKVIQWEDVES